MDLPGMPTRYELQRGVAENGDTLVTYGPKVLFRFDAADKGMRNLSIVALTEAGVEGKLVAEVFGVRAEHVSRLRTKAFRRGSAGLVVPMGAPRKLSSSDQRKAYRLADEGLTGAEIASRFGVSASTISRLLARRPDQPSLPLSDDLDGGEHETDGEQGETDDDEQGGQDPAEAGKGESAPVPVTEDVSEREAATASALSRLQDTSVSSRYAGAMLLHAFLDRLGVSEVLGAFPAGAERRFDAGALVLSSTFGFALGISSLEGGKHLRVQDAGALVGLQSFPHLRTLRPRLKALAEASDPLAIQRAFATSMLARDDDPPELFYIDDHFVTYWGAQPVGKGYNVRRHLAEPGRDDTYVVDQTWRAICFSSGEPRGLSQSLPEVLGQLREIVGDRKVMVGFDRGGSYPKVFSAIAAAGMDWVTWRRAPLVVPSVPPRNSWVEVDGHRRYLPLADEEVSLPDYHETPVRQLSSYENGKLAFQVLTSNTKVKGAPMVKRLRGRWCIENSNKYLEHHQGVHWLCSYEMDSEEDTTMVINPARRAATGRVATATSVLAEKERELGRCLGEGSHDAQAYVAALRAARDEVAMAKDDLEQAKASLRGVPAKLPRSSLDPNAKRAKPVLAARALQMVCRLLAYNAELDLARRLNVYLADADEYRAITRNILHLGGQINYKHRDITVGLDRPDSPRIARALSLLVEELNARPPRLAGDRRTITYRVGGLSA
jgi:transcriptional regulator with XRE-family HTH domain